MRLDFKDYYIDSDEHNFILGKVNIKGEDSANAGETYEVNIGYYGTLGQALKGYLKHSLRKNSDDVTTVESLLKRLDELETKIDKVKLSDLVENKKEKKGK